MPAARHERVRKKYHILVEGEGIPPPIKSFREMKFPQGNLEANGNVFIIPNKKQCLDLKWFFFNFFTSENFFFHCRL